MGHTYTKKKKIIIDVKLKFNRAFLCSTSLRKGNMLFPGGRLSRMLAVLLKIPVQQTPAFRELSPPLTTTYIPCKI